MRFHRLTLLNFKSYVGEPTVISFDESAGLYNVEGCNYLASALGSNGAGKSTCFDALAWVIYGKTLRDERPGAEIEPWSGERPTLVSLQFHDHGQVYAIQRGRHPNLLQWATYENGCWSDYADCDQAKISELFPLSYEAFRNTIVLPQFGKTFLEMAPEEQSKFFSDTLNLDVWTSASERAATLARQTTAEYQGYGNELHAIAGRLSELADLITIEMKRASEFAAVRQREQKECEISLAEARQALKAVIVAPMPSDAVTAKRTAFLTTLRQREHGSLREADRYKHELASLDRDISTTSALLASFDVEPDVCPACGQPVSKAHFRAERAKLDMEVHSLEGKRANCYQQYVAALQEAGDMSGKVTKALANAEKERKAYDALVISRARSEAKRQTLEAAIARLTADLAKRKVNPYVKSLAELKQRKQATRLEQEAVAEQFNEAAAAVESYKYWADAYRKIRLQLIDDVLAALERSTNAHIEELGLVGWTLTLATEKQTQDGKISAGFSCLLYPPGKQEPVRYKSYCGGEFQRLNLAIRFAMSELLLEYAGMQTNVEFLDEPIAHLSQEGINDLLVCLRARALRLDRQILFVDQAVHDRSMFDGVYLVKHDVDGAHVSLETL